MPYVTKGQIAACCQLGYLKTRRDGSQVFEQFADCKVGTITQKAMLQICGIDCIDDLAQTHIDRCWVRLQSKLISKVKQNLTALHNQIKRVAVYSDPALKMYRITSDLLPLYTHKQLGQLYDDNVMTLIANSLQRTGKVIRDTQIRVTSHPSQYTTLSSDIPRVIDNSIVDLEHHVKVFKLLELNPDEHGVVINIHANGKSWTLPDRACHLFSWLSLENDEHQAGYDKVLHLCKTYGIRYVFDIHHHAVQTGGDYPSTDSSVIRDVLSTWPENQVPLFHLSQSRDSEKLIGAHSDMITDKTLICHAKQFLQIGSIDIEAKHKNLASEQFLASVRSL